jgi:hypothetical protein
MRDLEFPNDHYGVSTLAIRRILELAQRDLGHFEVRPQSKDLVASLVMQHTDRLGQAGFVLPEIAGIRWLEGEWRLLHHDLWGEDPYQPWGSQWKETDRLMGSVGEEIMTRIEADVSVKSLVRPPLWPMSGRPGFCGFCFAAQHQKLNRFVEQGRFGSRDRATAWGLLCQAESTIWNALLWELGSRSWTSANPFLPLLEMYRCGYYPMGIDRMGRSYSIFGYQAAESNRASRGFYP